MRYEETENVTEKQFRRLTGVTRALLGKTLAVLHTAYALKKTRGDRPTRLRVENTLMTAREYRTSFH
jgi:hypothetical protein